MINDNFIISVKNNSNQIISSSDDKFPELKNGSLIHINNENYLYSISHKETINYYNSFQSQNTKTIIIKDNDNKLQKEDTIKLFYDEFEAKVITNIKNKGTGYKNGDVVSILGGKTMIDDTIRNISSTLLKVKLTSSNGEIEQLEIVKNGKYIEAPINPLKTDNGSGNGLEVEVVYMKSPTKPFLHRKIEDIHSVDGEIYIMLGYGLPENVKSGEINVRKTIIHLYENYRGETRSNCECKIYSHFTPYMHLPLMLKNSLSPDIVFNKCMIDIDRKIKELEDKINK